MKMNFQLIQFTVILLAYGGAGERGDYIGCYSFADDLLNVHYGQSADECVTACEAVFYRYAVLGNQSTCFCANSAGRMELDPGACDEPCPKNATQRCGGVAAASAYDTAVTVPGAPAELRVRNLTETTMRLQWAPPEAYTTITGYVIRAQVLRTQAEIILPVLEWRVSNDTFHNLLLNLHPGSLYNISLSALNDDEEGPNVSAQVETIIGTPDPSPPDIVIKERHGDRMVVHIPEAKNVNGPVSLYRIVVSIELSQQNYLIENLSNFTFASENGIPYYITAELDPEDIKHDFTIGDRSTYNGFYNAPLLLTNDIAVSLGIVSEKNHVRKIRYAQAKKIIILTINEPENKSPMVVALGAGIAIGVVLLLIGVGFLIILRKRIYFARIQRGSQSMPLSLSEPCIEIENSGFLQEGDERVDYYGNLKRKLWNIPRDLIDIDISCVVGVGSFGKFTKGKVQQHGAPTPSLIQVIPDRELDRSNRKRMLQELDLLIKTFEHDNVISLIGICETNTTLFVAVQDWQQTLKELLLQSRERDLQRNKFCLVSERDVLRACADVARGMQHLQAAGVLHGRLCCRSVALGAGGAARVAGFGLAHVRPPLAAPDYTRWSAHEVLRGARAGAPADVWSFGVLLWEALALGATPLAQAAGRDVAPRVLRGARPPQPAYASDELFQLSLQCWQVDPDERPTWPRLARELARLAEAPTAACLTFTHYSGFEFEPYVPEYEAAPA